MSLKTKRILSVRHVYGAPASGSFKHLYLILIFGFCRMFLVCKSRRFGFEIIRFSEMAKVSVDFWVLCLKLSYPLSISSWIKFLFPWQSETHLNHHLNRKSNRNRICTSSCRDRAGNVCLGLVVGNNVRGRGLFSSVAHRVWAVLHKNDTVKSLQAPPQV